MPHIPSIGTYIQASWLSESPADIMPLNNQLAATSELCYQPAEYRNEQQHRNKGSGIKPLQGFSMIGSDSASNRPQPKITGK